jgi:hypothetical protein
MNSFGRKRWIIVQTLHAGLGPAAKRKRWSRDDPDRRARDDAGGWNGLIRDESSHSATESGRILFNTSSGIPAPSVAIYPCPIRRPRESG